jgi:hypothetical protein
MELHTTPLGRLCRLPADDARAILDHITALTALTAERDAAVAEVAQIMAWLRQEYVDMMDAAHGNADDILQAEVVNEITDAIAAGAHKETTDG